LFVFAARSRQNDRLEAKVVVFNAARMDKMTGWEPILLLALNDSSRFDHHR
jgi:hypothetical protein